MRLQFSCVISLICKAGLPVRMIRSIPPGKSGSWTISRCDDDSGYYAMQAFGYITGENKFLIFSTV
ncbi:hypothetical protein ACJIZ3_005190 [Penstemon smallii]|uniref:Uncharacterized protein n=1 Tax=Penstemon smallii TaxID=265156 RepID=A0ABD3S464_9LAMI